MNRRYLNRTIVKKNLVNIELQKDSTVSQHLQLTLFNTRSINNKAMYLKDFVVDHEIDLLALTETWLDSMDNQTPNTINELCPSGSAFTHVPRVQNDILMALDSRKCVILLLLDLSAAFDTVDHENLAT